MKGVINMNCQQKIFRLSLLSLFFCLCMEAANMKNLADIRRERHELARARARVIINNDGCDMLYFPKGKPVTADAFLEQRTIGLTDKQLTTISYCTISS